MSFDAFVEGAGRAIDAAGIAILIGGALIAMGRYVADLRRGLAPGDAYHGLRRHLGQAILLGLELLVAADIIKTVAIAPTIESVAALGLIVLVRSFLSLTLQLEIEGRWPWQGRSPAGDR
jgi:uncharacterized membrane protein